MEATNLGENLVDVGWHQPLLVSLAGRSEDLCRHEVGGSGRLVFFVTRGRGLPRVTGCVVGGGGGTRVGAWARRAQLKTGHSVHHSADTWEQQIWTSILFFFFFNYASTLQEHVTGLQCYFDSSFGMEYFIGTVKKEGLIRLKLYSDRYNFFLKGAIKLVKWVKTGKRGLNSHQSFFAVTKNLQLEFQVNNMAIKNQIITF